MNHIHKLGPTLSLYICRREKVVLTPDFFYNPHVEGAGRLSPL